MSYLTAVVTPTGDTSSHETGHVSGDHCPNDGGCDVGFAVRGQGAKGSQHDAYRPNVGETTQRIGGYHHGTILRKDCT